MLAFQGPRIFDTGNIQVVWRHFSAPWNLMVRFQRTLVQTGTHNIRSISSHMYCFHFPSLLNFDQLERSQCFVCHTHHQSKSFFVCVPSLSGNKQNVQKWFVLKMIVNNESWWNSRDEVCVKCSRLLMWWFCVQSMCNRRAKSLPDSKYPNCNGNKIKNYLFPPFVPKRISLAIIIKGF